MSRRQSFIVFFFRFVSSPSVRNVLVIGIIYIYFLMSGMHGDAGIRIESGRSGYCYSFRVRVKHIFAEIMTLDRVVRV